MLKFNLIFYSVLKLTEIYYLLITKKHLVGDAITNPTVKILIF